MTVKIDPDLAVRTQALAGRNGTSAENLINVALDAYLEETEKLPGVRLPANYLHLTERE